jgi:hypothetical protein
VAAIAVAVVVVLVVAVNAVVDDVVAGVVVDTALQVVVADVVAGVVADGVADSVDVVQSLVVGIEVVLLPPPHFSPPVLHRASTVAAHPTHPCQRRHRHGPHQRA